MNKRVSAAPYSEHARTPILSAIAGIVLFATQTPALGNGFAESRAWQFQGPNERSVNVATLDMMERKRGGFYDSFLVVNHNTNITNIGTQLNCNNVADAAANRSSQSQRANSPETSNISDISSDAAGNTASGSVGGDGKTDTGLGGSVDSNQDNSGAISSGVADSSNRATSGAINAGSSSSRMSSDQDNSGAITAGIDASVACGLDGAHLNGHVQVDAEQGAHPMVQN